MAGPTLGQQVTELKGELREMAAELTRFKEVAEFARKVSDDKVAEVDLLAKKLQEKKLYTVQDLAALELRYHTLRLARLQALGGPERSVLESERRLRVAVGLPPEDGCRLIPTDTPTTASYVPDWKQALAAALSNRPELTQARQEVQKFQLDLKRLANQTLPDLRAVGSYDFNGLGNRLDGPGPDAALHSLTSNQFHDWTVGMVLDVPVGFRAANSQLRRGQLLLAQRLALLGDLEQQTAFALQQSYREILRANEAVRIQGDIRKAAAERYQALYDLFRAGLEGPTFVLLAQEEWTNATAAERNSIFAYNVALARFELEKGTIQEYDQVSITEGPLPACAETHASTHIGERQRALLLRQRPAPPAVSSTTASPLEIANAPPVLPTLPLHEEKAKPTAVAPPPHEEKATPTSVALPPISTGGLK